MDRIFIASMKRFYCTDPESVLHTCSWIIWDPDSVYGLDSGLKRSSHHFLLFNISTTILIRTCWRDDCWLIGFWHVNTPYYSKRPSVVDCWCRLVNSPGCQQKYVLPLANCRKIQCWYFPAFPSSVVKSSLLATSIFLSTKDCRNNENLYMFYNVCS